MANVPRETVINVEVNSQSPLASDSDVNSIHNSSSQSSISSSSSSSSRNSSPQPPSSVTSVSPDHSLPGTSSLPPQCHVFTHLHPVTGNNDQSTDFTIVHHDYQKVHTSVFHIHILFHISSSLLKHLSKQRDTQTYFIHLLAYCDDV